MKKTVLSILFAAMVFSGCDRGEKAAPVGQPAAPITADNQINLLKDILKQDPKNLDALIKLGNIYMDSQQFQEAADSYQRALDVDPKNVDVRVDMGTCLRGIGRPDRAVEEYRKALEINPNHLNANRNLGVVLAYDLGDKKGAAKAFENYLRLAPDAPDAAQIRGEIQKLTGK